MLLFNIYGAKLNLRYIYTVDIECKTISSLSVWSLSYDLVWSNDIKAHSSPYI